MQQGDRDQREEEGKVKAPAAAGRKAEAKEVTRAMARISTPIIL